MRVIAITILLFGAIEASTIRAPRQKLQAQPVQQDSPQPSQTTQDTPRASSHSEGGGAATQKQPAGGTQHRTEGYSDGGGTGEEVSTQDPLLTLLLQDSTFSCSGKSDGYYADNSVNCQAFHFCVGGVMHSWKCPSGLIFHQVHLNCVPSSQDLCTNAEKFAEDYVHKEVYRRVSTATLDTEASSAPTEGSA